MMTYHDKLTLKYLKMQLLILVLLIVPLSAQDTSKTDSSMSPLSGRRDLRNLSMGISAQFGTHVRGAGTNLHLIWLHYLQDVSRTINHVSLSAEGSLRGYLENLGISGYGADTRFVFRPSLGLEKSRQIFSGPAHRYHASRYNFFCYYAIYLSTDGSSQNSGGIGGSIALDKNLFKIQYENDWYSFLFTDQYRTAAVDITFLRNASYIYGGSAGFKLWTGQTRGIPTHFDKHFPITGQHGSEFSHGIIYISCILMNMKLSLGYDSETIRDFIQNNYHRLRNIGEIHPLDREDRFYLQFSINEFGTLY
ncbi:polymorphic toxin type 23 domain-containing protein [Fibrobacterota bacterium]